MAASDSNTASGEETISRPTIIYIVVSIFLCAAALFCLYRFVIRKQGWLCTARHDSLPGPATTRRRVPTRRGLTSPVTSIPRTFKPATAKAHATADLKDDYVPPYSRSAAQTPRRHTPSRLPGPEATRAVRRTNLSSGTHLPMSLFLSPPSLPPMCMSRVTAVVATYPLWVSHGMAGGRCGRPLACNTCSPSTLTIGIVALVLSSPLSVLRSLLSSLASAR
ncbi:hypothetical protein C8Q80DRAFT_370631 [Daedaleopsis nitida]|nr:hypothetical protein C8Q80DRAFT_370631 [Daedaleopsis nitida]